MVHFLFFSSINFQRYTRKAIYESLHCKKVDRKEILGLLKYLSIEFLILDVVCLMTHQAVQTN